jgi:uncharacterized protein YhbP (UPF0306 family)
VSSGQDQVEIPQHVRDYLAGQRTMTLATASAAGVPNAGTFLYVNEGPRLYFWTKPQTTTARHVEQNPLVSLTIDEYTSDLHQTRGVQARGECTVLLSGEEIARVAAMFGDKFPELAPGATMSISFFRIVLSDLQFIDNSAADTVSAQGAFGAEFHSERAYSVYAELPTQQVESIVEEMDRIEVAEGDVVARQGGPADRFLIVVDGELEIVQDDTARGTVGPGSLFGELAIMGDRPRVATLRATKPTTLLVMERDAFRDVVAQALGTTGEFDKVIQQRLTAAAGEA